MGTVGTNYEDERWPSKEDLDELRNEYDHSESQSPGIQSTENQSPEAVLPPQVRRARNPDLFGAFFIGFNGEVTAGYTNRGKPNTIVAPPGTKAEAMAFKKRAFSEGGTDATSSGISYAYYEGNWNKLPGFSGLPPVNIGTSNNFDISVRQRDDGFALVFDGYIDIPSKGTYTFYTKSDDGSRLWINQTLVIDNDGLHAILEKTGAIELGKGKHYIKVEYFERGGDEVLEVSYKGPKISKQKIPSAILYRSFALRLWQGSGYVPALHRTPEEFLLAYPHQAVQFNDYFPAFFADSAHSFFMFPSRESISVPEFMMGDSVHLYLLGDVGEFRKLNIPEGVRWRFSQFSHPFVDVFMQELNRGGIKGLYNPQLQIQPETFLDNKEPFNFASVYAPDPAVVDANHYPAEIVDFGEKTVDDGAYSLYNWELFFHAPLLIADRLSKNQRFEEAQRWFHYIFDPTARSAGTAESDGPWRFKPFQGIRNQSLEELLAILSSDADCGENTALIEQVRRWQKDPFNPHLIARMRWTAYQKTVVMKYIDNLIAWADQLFRRDTIESINEATQLYILASELLGSRPKNIPDRNVNRARTFNELHAEREDLLVRLENLTCDDEETGSESNSTPPFLTAPHYFCIPKNDQLLEYWDTVEDRLFKIRNCQNIEGVYRQLALFAPPIEPGLLVRAAAGGVDISSVLNEINAPIPHYRFRTMLAKATELCADLKSLGASLLAALEKRDAEKLALLRSSHEIRVLEAVQSVKERQINEAKEALKGSKLAKNVTEARRDYYRDIEKINKHEQENMDKLNYANILNMIAQGFFPALALTYHIADFDVGTSGWAASPVIKFRTGGSNWGPALRAFVEGLKMASARLSHEATMASIDGSHERRWNEWKLQERLAEKELDQLDKQIAAAEIRVELAEKDLGNHELQIENSKAAETFLKDKFTNRELYDWMVSQISAVYFQSYQLAYDIAKRAQRAYQFERSSDESFIEFGYWDSLKKGLLAGEKLYHDAKRMEMAYLDQNRRDYELSKHVSLVLLDPVALLKLKETGECFIDLPEEVFDMDNPGHYMRRIKTINVSVPCVSGPYTNINCTLTLLWNSVRRNTRLPGVPDGDDPYAHAQVNGTFRDDERFIDSIGAIQSIVTSSGRDDSGLFEQNLQDERYLPFEGAGAISRWRIQLPKETNQFDFDTISDVVLTLRYTAREGGDALRQAALAHLEQWVKGAGNLYKVFSARHQFPDAWHRFLTPMDSDPIHRLELKDLRKLVPAILGKSELEIQSMTVLMGIDETIDYPSEPDDPDKRKLRFELSKDDKLIDGKHTFELGRNPVPVLPAAQVITTVTDFDHSTWQLSVSQPVVDDLADNDSLLVVSESIDGGESNRLDRDKLQDIWFLVEYSVKTKPAQP